MEELSIEEKAKAYDEALERAKKWYNAPNVDKIPTFGNRVIEEIFPELKESEDERIRKAIIEHFAESHSSMYPYKGFTKKQFLAWLEKQSEQKPPIEMKSAEESLGIDSETYNKIVDECIYDKQKSQRMISAEAKEAMYDKPADTVEQKCEESKTKIFDAPTPFEDKLYAFVLACEILVDPSKREFILEHSQEILDAAKEQIGKEQKPAWSIKEKLMLNDIIETTERSNIFKENYQRELIDWLKSLKTRYTWKPSDAQMASITCAVRKMKESACYDSELVSLLNDLKKLK